MIRYLTLEEVLDLHERLIDQSGGTHGVHDQNGLESAIGQPMMAFGGHDLYQTTAEKGAALAFSLVMNHPFVDGNKRIGHAAMETFLVLNGHEVKAAADGQEEVFLNLAAGTLEREDFVEWVRSHMVPIGQGN